MNTHMPESLAYDVEPEEMSVDAHAVHGVSVEPLVLITGRPHQTNTLLARFIVFHHRPVRKET